MVTTSKAPAPAQDAGGASPSLASIVPACPQGVAITKADFLKPDFSVDNFFIEVSVREGGASLDTLRDELGMYLKVLRSSMIELINQDYADFVQLSTVLVGVDQGILAIREPIEGFSKEVAAARAELASCLDRVRVQLARRERIRQDKERLAALQQVAATTVKVERMLGSSGAELSTDTAERIATDINQLNFAVWKMKDSKFIQQISPRVTAVCDALNTWLDDTCVAAIRATDAATRDSEQSQLLARCLRIYATIDRVANIEKLVRDQIVKPQVEVCLSEAESVGSSRLGAVCSALLGILPAHLAPLLRLTSAPALAPGSAPPVPGFDFLAHSFWPEVAEQFVSRLSHVASPGNPAEFLANYETSLKFLEDFEANLDTADSLGRVRDSAAYADFMQLWNLAVYFQIRFQEIARPVEAQLTESTAIARAEGEGAGGVQLRASEVAVAAMGECFQPGVYTAALAHRFLQLALQIVARYKVWAEHCLHTFHAADTGEAAPRDMRRSETSKNLQSLEASTKKSAMPKSASEKDLASAGPSSGGLTVTMPDLVLLHADLGHLAAALPQLISPPAASVTVDISPAVAASVSGLSSLLPSLSRAISGHIAAAPVKSVRGVSDVPRMYRRTNRATPSAPCSYVTQAVAALARAHSEQLDTWLEEAVQTVAAAYLLQVQDVLANVSKMEESLRKLKKVRERGGAGAGERGTKEGDRLSDDDKIRLQLYLDVTFFLRELGGGSVGEMAGLLAGDTCTSLSRVVQEAVTSFVADIKL